MTSPSPVTGYTDPTGVVHEVSTSDQALAGRFYLRRPAGTGYFCLLMLPVYQPTTDLTWLDPATASSLQPSENWPASARPPLLNIGPHTAALVGESVTFDASLSSGDLMSDVTGISWSASDGATGSGMTFTHSFTATGTYTVTATVGSTSTTRQVRVVSSWNNSDYDIISIDALGATSDQGWSLSVTVAGDATNLADYQGVVLIYVDETEIAWRASYDREIRRLGQSLLTGAVYSPDMSEMSAHSRVIFNGYLLNANSEATLDNTQTKTKLDFVGSAAMLDQLSRRREVFWETAQANTGYGGTVMGAAPMKIATCIHHSLTSHTNFPAKHDVLLDWTGARMTGTSANEGAMWSALRSWADNDFARLWTDHAGRLRYEPIPHYRGKSWHDQALNLAVWIPPYVVESFSAIERQGLHRTAWAKLCGANSTGNCELCAAYPCDGPAPGPAGEWEIKRGLQYDDYKTLCVYASYEFAYQNRGYDVTLTLPARHDLELNDLVKLPLKDPNGRFDWSVDPKVFVVVGISHQIDLAARSWQTTVQCEELTTNTPCDCPEPVCPQQPGSGSSGTGTVHTPGDVIGTRVSCSVSQTDSDWSSWSGSSDNSPSQGAVIQTTGPMLWLCPSFQDHFQSVVVALSVFVFCVVSESNSYTAVTAGGTVDATKYAYSTTLGNDLVTSSDTSAGTPGVWSVSSSSKVSVHGGGGLGAVASVLSRSSSWVDLTVTGPAGSTQSGTLGLTITDSSGGGFFRVLVVDLEPGGSGSDTSSGDVLLIGSDPTLDSPITNGTVAASFYVVGSAGLGASGVPTLILGTPYGPGDQINVPLHLGASPGGHRWRVGIESDLYSGHEQTFHVWRGYANLCQATYTTGCMPTQSDVGCPPSACGGGCWDPCGTCDLLCTGKHCEAWGPFSSQDELNTFASHFGSPFTVRTPQECSPWSPGYIDEQFVETIDEDEFVADATFAVSFAWSQCVGAGSSVAIPGSVGGWSGYGGGYYGGGPIVGTCGNWPTADAINHRISLSESANGRTSPLDGLGSTFISLAQHYGINPGVVTAILQRESQLGSDGSLLPSTANNFGGVTGSGPCGSVTSGSHDFAVYCSAAQGLEAVFQTLDKSIYRDTGGRLADVMNIYSPPFENDVADMWNIFSVVASDLGITLVPDTQVFADATCTQANPISGGQPIPAPPPGPGYGGYTTMFEYVLHQANCVISQGPWGPYSHQVCDCYDFAVPIGTPVYPVAPGTVTLSESTDGVYTPNHIIIQTAWGPLHYAHFTQRLVNVGDVVGLETLIGYSGTAGTGPHIHLGLEYGASSSPYGYSLTQTLAAIGFNVNGFPWEG